MTNTISRCGFDTKNLTWHSSLAGFDVAQTFDGEIYVRYKDGQIEKVEGDVTVDQLFKYGLWDLIKD